MALMELWIHREDDYFLKLNCMRDSFGYKEEHYSTLGSDGSCPAVKKLKITS